MPYEDADEVPEESDFRFVVLGHPELGEFLDWAVAVAKAWEVTLPGQKRTEVALVQRGLTQLRTEDPDTDVSAHGATVIDLVLDKDDSSMVVHLVERAHLSWVQMHCGRVSRRKHLVPVPGPKGGNECRVCFDPDFDPPPRPAHW